jgi:hypothetical protein
MSEISLEATDFSKFLHFEYENDYRTFSVECNFCSREGYMFYSGSLTEANGSDWIVKAAIHIKEYHPKGPPA